MRNTTNKNFNHHVYTWYEYKAILKIKSESFSRDKFYRPKKRNANTIINENKKQYYFKGKRISLTENENLLFIAKKLIENNRIDLLTNEFFEIEK